MRPLDPHEVKQLFDKAIEDVERQLFYDIKRHPSQRADLLSQVDVLVKVKERIDGRIHYPDPLADS
jgi:hypothetical protein